MGALKFLLVIMLCVPIAFLGYTLLSGLTNEALNIRAKENEAREVARRRR